LNKEDKPAKPALLKLNKKTVLLVFLKPRQKRKQKNFKEYKTQFFHTENK